MTNLAAQLMRALTDPDLPFQARRLDVSQLSDQELGDLLPAAYGLGPSPTPSTGARSTAASWSSAARSARTGSTSVPPTS